MNRSITQAAVAIIGMLGLTIITGLAVTASLFYDAPKEIPFMLAGALVSATSMAGAWLFRLNGTTTK